MKNNGLIKIISLKALILVLGGAQSASASIVSDLHTIRDGTVLYVSPPGSSHPSWSGTYANPEFPSGLEAQGELVRASWGNTIENLAGDYQNGLMNGSAQRAVREVAEGVRSGSVSVRFIPSDTNSGFGPIGSGYYINIGGGGTSHGQALLHESDHFVSRNEIYPGQVGEYLDELERNITSTYGDLDQAIAITNQAYRDRYANVKNLYPDFDTLSSVQKYELIHRLDSAERAGVIGLANLEGERLREAQRLAKDIAEVLQSHQGTGEGLIRYLAKHAAPLGKKALKFLPLVGIVSGAGTFCVQIASGNICGAGITLVDTVLGEVLGPFYDAAAIGRDVGTLVAEYKNGREESGMQLKMLLFGTLFDDEIKLQLSALLDELPEDAHELRSIIAEMIASSEIDAELLEKFWQALSKYSKIKASQYAPPIRIEPQPEREFVVD